MTLFHGDACEALGEDAALELTDWALRRLLWLTSPAGHAFAKAAGACSGREPPGRPDKAPSVRRLAAHLRHW